MKHLLAACALLILPVSTAGQSRIEANLTGAGDTGGAAQGISAGIGGRVLFKFGDNAIDLNALYIFKSPESVNLEGQKLSTHVLFRRSISGPAFIVAGVDINKLHEVLIDATATNAVTGVGLELGQSFTLTGVYEPHDFSSGQGVSIYKVDADVIAKRFEKPNIYVAIKAGGDVSRFQPEDHALRDIVTIKRVRVTVSIGKSF